jgi:hypothetical protein
VKSVAWRTRLHGAYTPSWISLRISPTYCCTNRCGLAVY